MPDKKRRTITLDERIDRELQSEDVNASGLINRLLDEYYSSGLAEEAALRVKLNDLQQERQKYQSKRELADSQIQKIEDEVDLIKDELNNLDQQEVEQVETVVNLVLADQSGIDQDQLSTDNELVKHRAGKAGMTPDRFVREVNERVNSA